MTVNKSQGQTLSRCGIWLPHPLFSHGQLYVAHSRCGDPDGVTVLIQHPPLNGEEAGTATRNVVYTELLQRARGSSSQQPTTGS